MHRANLTFEQGQWTASFIIGPSVSDHVLAHLIPKVWRHVDTTWGPYDKPYAEVEVVPESGRTPLRVHASSVVVSSVYEPMSDSAPYETVIVIDDDATRAELHQVTYAEEDVTSTSLRLSLDDIVRLVPGLSAAGNTMSFSRAAAAMFELDHLTPDSLENAAAWPPPLWARAGLLA